MAETFRECIRERKSIRTFSGESVKKDDKRKLEQYFSVVSNPFHIPVAFRLLDPVVFGLSSPVIRGANLYFGAKVKCVPNFELALGFCFEKVCIYAWSLGLGTVILAGSLNRPAFEKAMELGENEVMPVASPIGIAAEKKSIRETLMRKAVRADERLPFEQLFFEHDFRHPLSSEAPYADVMEMVRLAPSAVNRQPWRIVVDGDIVHFYETRSMKDSPKGDIQKIDMGIAMSHFDMSLREAGILGCYSWGDPELEAPERTEYIISWKKRPV